MPCGSRPREIGDSKLTLVGGSFGSTGLIIVGNDHRDLTQGERNFIAAHSFSKRSTSSS
jgi:hypothetical protein